MEEGDGGIAGAHAARVPPAGGYPARYPFPESIRAAARFAESLGSILPPALRNPEGAAEGEAARKRLLAMLNRPMRVCAMVENRGEPGGGPFWVRAADGSLSLQIVETPQTRSALLRQQKIAAEAGYFNPTDLVCALRGCAGAPV